MLKKQRTKLVRTVQGLFMVALSLLTLLILIIQVSASHQRLSLQTEKMRADYVEQQKTDIKNESERVLRTIDFQRSRIEKQAREIVQQRVYEAIAIAQNIYEKNKGKNRSDIQQSIFNALRPIRFNQNSGYFVILSRSDGVALFNAATPEVEGKARLNVQNADGQFVIKDLIALTGENTEGFYEYVWTKPEQEGNRHKKVAFAKRFEPYDWLIATGLYVEDVEAQVKSEVLEEISAIRFGQNGYFFVSNWQGICLAHGAQPNLVGLDLWETVDSKGHKTSQSMIALAQEEKGGYVEFWWRKPDVDKERPKIAYSRGVPDWEWMIGTGVYIDDVEFGISQLEAALNKELYQELVKTILIAGLILILFIAVFRRINRHLLGDFSQFTTFFEQAANDDKEIDLRQLRFDELFQMAGNANRMLRDKMEVRQDLHNEKERYKALLDATFGGVIIHDQGLILDCSQRLSDMTGYALDELIGMEGFKLIAPDSLELVQKNIKNRYDQSYEVEGVRKDGTVYPLAIKGKNIRYQGREVRIIEFRDISDSKQAEEALIASEEMMRSSQSVAHICSYSTALNINEIEQSSWVCSPEFYNIFGIDETYPHTIAGWANFIHPDYREEVFNYHESVVKEKKSFDYEYKIIRINDGAERWVHGTGELSFDENGTPVRMHGAIQDITERKQTEAKNRRLELDLRQKYKMEAVGVMAGGMAHNFNNNLSIILGNLELTKMKLPPQSELSENLDNAKTAVMRSRDLIKQIMAYSRKDEQNKTPLQLSATIGEVVALLKSTIPSSVYLQQNLSPDSTQAYIHANASQIQEILLNLCNNAVHAMDEQGTLTLTLEPVELKQQQIPAHYSCTAGDYLCLSVQDTGCGMTPELQDKIFDPFFTTKEMYDGTGMGLSTVQGMMEQLQGMITVDSHVGVGSTFRLYFPVSDQNQESIAARIQFASATGGLIPKNT